MRFAAISDIHGKLVALDAVLNDLANDQYDEIVCLGDVALRGPQPRQCLQRIRDLGCPVVMGNTDAWLIESEPSWAKPDYQHPMVQIDLWCASQLTAADQDFIRAFQPTIEMPVSATQCILFYHGSPRGYTENIFSTTPDDELDNMLAGWTATTFVGGHTHIQMLRRHKAKTIVNVGSVGSAFRDPLDARNPFVIAPWAEYAVIDSQNGRLSVDFRRVPLDILAMNRAALESGMPHAEWLNAHFDRSLVTRGE